MRELSNSGKHRYGKAIISQRGIVVPIVVVGLLALFAVAGVTLDGSHALANKTRAQNTVDAAALAAAKVLDETSGDIAQAAAAANSLFAANSAGAGNHEMNNAYGAGDITVNVDFSRTVNPFAPGSGPGPFVRVSATGFDTQTTLSKVLGVDEIPTPATAVAGPSGPLGLGEGAEICDVAPIAVCNGDIPGPADQSDLRVLKPNPGTHGDIGPGNYKMLRMDDCGAGGSCLRENMAGAFGDCATVAAPVETEPGVSSGPVSQGFNTRFNQYQGAGLNASDYPPDQYIDEQGSEQLRACEDPNDPLKEYIFLTSNQGNSYCNGFDPTAQPWVDERVTVESEINYNYSDYLNDQLSPGGGLPNGVKDRRLLTFPLIDCSINNNGQSTLMVDGFACFFMLQSLPDGQAGGAGQIFGQYVSGCEANGSAGINPGTGPGPFLYKIQLYKDSDSGDS